jgi:serine/threonine protein kinase
MVADAQRIKELFLALLDKPAGARAEFLDSACAGDTALRQRLETMLRHHEDSGELMPRSPAEILADSGISAVGDTAAWPAQPDPSATSAAPVDPHSEPLPFLKPSAKPGSLGRLGHYEVQGVIGKGGFGIVLRAFDEKLHRVVAVKVLAPAIALIGSARERFIREARAAAAVKNEHVVAIYQVQDEQQPPYLVMELIDGITLQEKLDKKGPLPVKEILRIGVQTAEGLAAAHRQGLVHRDIKPANILLENGVERVKITDFGLARAVDDASISQSGTVAGTPMYMSPEQAQGLAIDHRSDLFSLGSLLYAMCTGHPPFRASGTHAVLKRVIDASPRPIREINNEIPGWLADIIARLHARKPEDRFQTAREVADLLSQRLADVQAGRAGSVSDRSDVRAPLRPPRRWLHGAAVGVPILAGLAVVAIVMARRWFPPDSQTAPPQEPPAFVAVFGGPGWHRLYDGKSYAGWKPFGNSNAGAGEFLLFPGAAVDTLDKLPRNFHLRMEVNLVAGQGTVRFHAQPRPQEANPPYPKDGWFLYFNEKVTGKVNAELHSRSPAAAEGDINTAFGGTIADCGKWFYLEIITRDEGTRVLINGRDCLTAGGKVTAGVLSLWNSGARVAGGRDSQIAFRNIEIKDLTPPAAEPGWVQLFNGKDLAGWKMFAPGGADWKVEDGELVGRSPPSSWLFSEAGHYQDFHLRAEVKINADGDSGLFFRAPFQEFSVDAPPGYEADLCFREGTPSSPVGSLWKAGKRMQRALKSATGPDQWFTLEVMAVGPRLKVLVNGNTVADYTDPGHHFRKGHIALQAHTWHDGGNSTVVRFRKIEIKELPPPAPGWLLRFDGADQKVEVPALQIDRLKPHTIECYVTATKVPNDLSQHVVGLPDQTSLLIKDNKWAYSLAWVNAGNQSIKGVDFVVGPAVERGRRVHLAAELLGDQMRLYVDGKFVGFRPTGPVREKTLPFMIGGHGFEGSISEVRVSNIARYSGPFTPAQRFEPDKNTLALYHCDQGQGDKLLDSSGNNHHGRIVGARWVKAASGTP